MDALGCSLEWRSHLWPVRKVLQHRVGKCREKALENPLLVRSRLDCRTFARSHTFLFRESLMPTATESAELVEAYTDFALSTAEAWGTCFPWLADGFASKAGQALWRVARIRDHTKIPFWRSVGRAVLRGARPTSDRLSTNPNHWGGLPNCCT